MPDCYVTGVGSCVPAESLSAWLSGTDAVELFEPRSNLDRRKIRYKDRSTVLALAAVQNAIDLAGIKPPDSSRIAGFERTGVIAASNYGNLDTVCRAADCIAEQNSQATSPLDLPNASPNVVASSIAIYFGAGALNIMTTSGPWAGLDALSMAFRALRAGRADRLIVVGTESASDPVRRLLSQDGWEVDDGFEGAAAIILETERPRWRSCIRLTGIGEEAPDRSAAPGTTSARAAIRDVRSYGAHRQIAQVAQAVIDLQGAGSVDATIEADGRDLRVRVDCVAAEDA
jgi:3-oxoacyl-[acyl-carrier-protein] synthase II